MALLLLNTHTSTTRKGNNHLGQVDITPETGRGVAKLLAAEAKRS